MNPGYHEPFCTLANGSLYPGICCTGRDFAYICQGGAHREVSLYPGVCCLGGSLYAGFTVDHSWNFGAYPFFDAIPSGEAFSQN